MYSPTKNLHLQKVSHLMLTKWNIEQKISDQHYSPRTRRKKRHEIKRIETTIQDSLDILDGIKVPNMVSMSTP